MFLKLQNQNRKNVRKGKTLIKINKTTTNK